MLFAKARLVAFLVICAVLALAAGASIIVGILKAICSGGSAPDQLTQVVYFYGSAVRIWDWYSDSGVISDNLLSTIGILSLITFAISVAGGGILSRRFAELHSISRSLRMERLQNKYRGRNT